jgi:hypothetical protein
MEGSHPPACPMLSAPGAPPPSGGESGNICLLDLSSLRHGGCAEIPLFETCLGVAFIDENSLLPASSVEIHHCHSRHGDTYCGSPRSLLGQCFHYLPDGWQVVFHGEPCLAFLFRASQRALFPSDCFEPQLQ